ncbi:MAG: tetratricopeptide repeat protein [bacterium]|nr:tetratricopeptide repeat protein [bacterium]
MQRSEDGMRAGAIIVGVVVVMGMVGVVVGDTLVLKTGARYSGTIKRTEGGAIAIVSAQGTREFPEGAVNWRLTTFTAPADEGQVEEMMKKGEYGEVIPLLQRWEARYQKLPTGWYEKALYGLGLSYARVGKNDEAVKYFQRLLEAFPRTRYKNEAEAYLIDLQGGVGDEAGVEERLRQLLEDPKSNDRVRAKAHRRLGELRLQAGDVRGALEHYVHVVVLYGDQSDLQEEVQEKVADLYGRLGRTNEAIFYYEQLLEAYPESAATAARRERLLALKAGVVTREQSTRKGEER